MGGDVVQPHRRGAAGDRAEQRVTRAAGRRGPRPGLLRQSGALAAQGSVLAEQGGPGVLHCEELAGQVAEAVDARGGWLVGAEQVGEDVQQ